jgi:hypothetical protein
MVARLSEITNAPTHKISVALSLAAAASVLTFVACGGDGPTPTAAPTPVAVVPTPTPQPATPAPAKTLPAGMVCDPTPPPLYGLVLKVHNDTGGRKTLDSRPMVMNVGDFCEKAGFASSAKFCFTRTEGDSQAPACDYLAVGRSAQTGRWGPTWSWNGKPCTAGGGEDGCSNHPDNQFLVNTRGAGVFEACVAPDTPLSTDPERPGSRGGICRIEPGKSGCQ